MVRHRLCQLDLKNVLQTVQSNCNNLGVMTNMKRRIGPILGIKVGDIFYYQGTMFIIDLHIQMVGSIDYLTVKDLATSVVTCPCPLDCKNRVVQSGLKISVEVFKTKAVAGDYAFGSRVELGILLVSLLV